MTVNRQHRTYRNRRDSLVRQWKAQGRRCWLCSCELNFDQPGLANSVEADHETPLAQGGHILGPMSPACRRCNQRRGSKPADQYRATMQEKPAVREQTTKLVHRPDGWYLVYNAP